MEIIKEISDEVLDAIDSSFKTMAEKHYTEYILYIGRADIVPGLKQIVGTDCVIDYHLDYYYDKTRKEFYLHYLRRNYSTDGFKYDGESGIDDLSIEMMIYSHLCAHSAQTVTCVAVQTVTSETMFFCAKLC